MSKAVLEQTAAATSFAPAGTGFTVASNVQELVQPDTGSVYIYVIVCGPTPAIAGLNIPAATPVPEKVPPVGDRPGIFARSAGAAFSQIEKSAGQVTAIGSSVILAALVLTVKIQVWLFVASIGVVLPVTDTLVPPVPITFMVSVNSVVLFAKSSPSEPAGSNQAYVKMPLAVLPPILGAPVPTLVATWPTNINFV